VDDGFTILNAALIFFNFSGGCGFSASSPGAEKKGAYEWTKRVNSKNLREIM
jgi:hypothetical protein